jgi:beta-N-acetylhexosaminidase
MARYEVGDAAVRSIEAGVDLILLKDENALRGEVFQCLVDAVREERLSEERVNDAVGRVLSVKKRFGLLDGARGVVDTGSIAPRLDSHDRTSVAEEAAYKSIVVPRDRDGLLPLRKGARIAVFEECVGLMRTVNSEQAYCGALYEALLAQGMDAVLVDFEASRFEDAWPSMQLRAQEVDYIVHTGFFGRGVGHDHEIHGRIASLGTPTVFVTNNPYPMAVHPAISTVLVTFSAFAVSMRQVAAIVTGAREAVGRLEFDPERLYA